MLSKEVSSTIFSVFGMNRSRIEHWSTRPLSKTLPTTQWKFIYSHQERSWFFSNLFLMANFEVYFTPESGLNKNEMSRQQILQIWPTFKKFTRSQYSHNSSQNESKYRKKQILKTLLKQVYIKYPLRFATESMFRKYIDMHGHCRKTNLPSWLGL